MAKALILKDLITHLNLKMYQFEKEIGVANTTISKAIELNRDLSGKNIQKIVSRYPEVNKNWLYTGEEPMLLSVTENDSSLNEGGSKYTPKALHAQIPFYDIDVMAGVAELYNDTDSQRPAYYMDIPELKGCTAFRAYSESMTPKIISGAIIFCKKLEDWRDYVEYGQIYIVETHTKRRFLKYIRKSKDSEYFTMHSHNPEHEDFDVPKKNIESIWIVEGFMNKMVQ